MKLFKQKNLSSAENSAIALPLSPNFINFTRQKPSFFHRNYFFSLNDMSYHIFFSSRFL